MTRRRARRALFALIALVLVTSAGLAQAAGLDVDAGSLTPFEPSTRCTTATVAVTPGEVVRGVTDAVVVDVPAECAGLPVKVHLLDVPGAADVEVTAAAGPTTIPVGPNPAGEVAGAALVLGGWGVPTTWSYDAPPPEPVYPGNDATVVSEPRWAVTNQDPVQVCVAVDVTTDSPTPVEWRVELDLSLPPFNGRTDGYSLAGPDAWRFGLLPDTPSAGHLQVGGTPWGGAQTITAGQTYVVELCHWGLAAVDTPSAYTVTSEPSGTWTDTRACVVTTVAGNGTSPFWFGWEVVLDLQPAADHLAAAGRTLGGYEWDQVGGSLLRVPDPGTGPYAWRVTSSPTTTLIGSESLTFEVCALGG